MATDPSKTPLEIIYGGIATVFAVGAWFLGRRKARREYLDYEPVPRIDFEAHKKAMDSKFAEMDGKQMANMSTLLSSIQSLRVDWARIEAIEEEKEKRMDRIEKRLNDALDGRRED